MNPLTDLADIPGLTSDERFLLELLPLTAHLPWVVNRAGCIRTGILHDICPICAIANTVLMDYPYWRIEADSAFRALTEPDRVTILNRFVAAADNNDGFPLIGVHQYIREYLLTVLQPVHV